MASPRREEWEQMGYPKDMVDGLIEALGDISVTDVDIRVFLEAERNAWAFALRNMSSLVTDKAVLQELQKYIHEVPMKKQSEFLRSRGFVQ
jgi:hypothetical protein